MPNAVTHILITIIMIEIYRDYIVKNKKRFPLHYVLIGGIAGLIPDFDIIVFWMIYLIKGPIAISSVHRTFSHTLFLPLITMMAGFATLKAGSRKLGKHHLKLCTIFFVISFGIFIHLILDASVIGHIMPFYPITNYKIGFNLVYYLPVSKEVVEQSIPPAIDAALLVLWLIHEEWKHKISDFI